MRNYIRSKIYEAKYKLKRQKLKYEYGDLLDRVTEILFNKDPIKLDFGFNTDEYEAEAISIVRNLKDIDSEDKLLQYIYSEFIRQFDLESAGLKENYQDVASEIWKLWKEKTNSN